MSLNLSHQESDGIVVLKASGRLVGSDFEPDSENPLDKLLGRDWANRKIIFDLSDASFIDSSALGWLLLCKRNVDAGAGRLVLHSAPPPIQEMFRLMRMQSVLPLVHNEEEALEALHATDGDAAG